MKTCIKLLILLFISALFTSKVYAITIYHPANKYMTVKDSGLFFSGKINKHEKVFINEKPIIPSEEGAFSCSFPLNIGENIFEVRSKKTFGIMKTIKYNIIRQELPLKPNQNTFIQQTTNYYKVNKNISVLRSNPIDAGTTRMGYLPKETIVTVDGVYNEFSRIKLNKNNYGWIKTTDLVKTDDINFKYKPATIISISETKTEKENIFLIKLTDNVPYSAVVKDDKLVLNVYNLDCEDETYTKIFDLPKNPRYSVKMRNSILSVSQKKYEPDAYQNIKIVIDPGHGGKEKGAIGCLGDKEKNINLKVAKKLKKILIKSGYNTILTRKTDKYISLDDRIKCGIENDAMFFISIHMNSVPISSNPNLNEGTTVFYFNPQCKDFAQTLSSSISSGLGVNNEGAAEASFAVIRPTEYIGALVELVYMVNPNDVKIYKSKNFCSKSAKAVLRGITQYLEKSKQTL